MPFLVYSGFPLHLLGPSYEVRVLTTTRPSSAHGPWFHKVKQAKGCFGVTLILDQAMSCHRTRFSHPRPSRDEWPLCKALTWTERVNTPFWGWCHVHGLSYFADLVNCIKQVIWFSCREMQTIVCQVGAAEDSRVASICK